MHSAWTPDDAMWSSTIYAEGIKREVGALGYERFVAVRAAWLEHEQQRAARGVDRGFWWFPAYAQSAATVQDGRDALEALPRYAPIQGPFNRGLNKEEQVGRVYLLAGRASVALTSLRRAAASCGGLEVPTYWVRARVELGDALRATGQNADACEAYRTVLALWGRATPRSISAEHARAARTALRCPP
jgi:hypothetical protein